MAIPSTTEAQRPYQKIIVLFGQFPENEAHSGYFKFLALSLFKFCFLFIALQRAVHKQNVLDAANRFAAVVGPKFVSDCQICSCLKQQTCLHGVSEQ